MATTIDYAMPAEAYHAIEAFSASSVAPLLRSPQHFRAWRDAPREQTDAMLRGTVLHTAILEPDDMSRYVAVPDCDRRTKAGRDEQAEHEREARARGLIPVPAAMLDTVRDMQRAVLSHAGARRLLLTDDERQDGTSESTILWRDDETGAACKARVDRLRRDLGIIDLKSTRDASDEAFARSCATFLYHAQAAHYVDAVTRACGSPPPFFAWIAVESEPPHGVACSVITDDALRVGQELVRRARVRYAECIRAGEWPGYRETIEPLRLPPWALRLAAHDSRD